MKWPWILPYYLCQKIRFLIPMGTDFHVCKSEPRWIRERNNVSEVKTLCGLLLKLQIIETITFSIITVSFSNPGSIDNTFFPLEITIYEMNTENIYTCLKKTSELNIVQKHSICFLPERRCFMFLYNKNYIWLLL